MNAATGVATAFELGAANSQPYVAVVIPCYRVAERIERVIAEIGPCARWIICIDDGSPDDVAWTVSDLAQRDSRIHLLRHERNLGVGAATCTGYRKALSLGAHVVVKLDGDGQMDPRLIPRLVAPIVRGDADYVKGNRFFSLETLQRMSWSRKLGNAGLSFLSKLSTGYWDIFDPTNGFTAIETRVLDTLPLDRISTRYFFESDMLFRLATIRARVLDLPMKGAYADERSNLSEMHSLGTFPFLHVRNFAKRIVYSYFLRGFSVASVSLAAGFSLVLFGSAFGFSTWVQSSSTGVAATAGTVMLAALPIILGIQLILSFLAHDVALVPNRAIHHDIDRVAVMRAVEQNAGEGGSHAR